ncbi:MAG: hypothetical protein R3C53_07420 [Pirellulaceae bacterium]
MNNTSNDRIDVVGCDDRHHHSELWPMTQRRSHLVVVVLVLLGWAHPAYSQTTGSQTTSSQADSRLPIIAAGTIVNNPDGVRWNRIVLLARPRIASGDISALSTSVRDSVSTFVLTILATVEQVPNAPGPSPRFRLREVGLGYSSEIENVTQVVSSSSAAEQGLQLGFIQKQMLLENEKQLKKARGIARTSTLAIFDAPANVLLDDKHQSVIMRHFIWIDSQTGENASLIWMLAEDSGGELRVVDAPLRHLPSGLEEDRKIHIDGNAFILGIPSERAFALEGLPPGREFSWTNSARTLAAQKRYTMDDIRQLSAELNALMK